MPTVPKIYENILAKQINDYIENYFSNYLCGFRKALLLVSHVWKYGKKHSDFKGAASALLTDLSKVWFAYSKITCLQVFSQILAASIWLPV